MISNYLSGMAVVSSNNIWAVGGYLNASMFTKTLIEQWNGTSWNVIPGPNPGTHDTDLYRIAVVAAKNVWAVGDYSYAYKTSTLTEHYSS